MPILRLLIIILFGINALSVRAKDEVITFANVDEAVTLATFGHDYDNELLISPDQRILAQSGPFGVWLYDYVDLDEPRLLRSDSGGVLAMSFSPDSRRIVAGMSDGRLVIWDVESGDILQDWADAWDIKFGFVHFSPDGQAILSAHAQPQIRDSQTGAVIHTLVYEGGTRRSGTFSPDGERVAIVYDEGLMGVWDVETGEQVLSVRVNDSLLYHVAYSPDGSSILTTSADQTIQLWDAETGTSQGRLLGHKQAVTWASYLSDSRRILSISYDNTARLWDAETGQLLVQFVGHTAPIQSAVLNDDETSLLTTSWDKITRLWDVETGQVSQEIAHYLSRVADSVYDVDQSGILSLSINQSLYQWEITDRSLKRLWNFLSTNIVDMAVSADETLIVSVGGNGAFVHVWDIATGNERYTLDQAEAIQNVLLSPNGEQIITVPRQGSLKAWDVVTGDYLFTFEGEESYRLVEYSADETKLIAKIANDHPTTQETTWIWDAQTGERTFDGFLAYSALEFDIFTIKRILRLPPEYQWFALSRDENILAYLNDNAIGIWNDETSTLRIVGQGGYWGGLFFTPDSRLLFSPDTLLATLFEEGIIVIWDTLIPSNPHTLRGHHSKVNKILFNDSQTRFYTSSEDGTVRIWGIPE